MSVNFDLNPLCTKAFDYQRPPQTISMTELHNRMLRVCAALLVLARASLVPAPRHGADFAPPRLLFDELITPSEQNAFAPALQAKLDAILTTPTTSCAPAPLRRGE